MSSAAALVAELLAGDDVDDRGRRQRDALAQEDLAALGGLDEADVLAVGLVPGSQSEPLARRSRTSLL